MIFAPRLRRALAQWLWADCEDVDGTLREGGEKVRLLCIGKEAREFAELYVRGFLLPESVQVRPFRAFVPSQLLRFLGRRGGYGVYVARLPRPWRRLVRRAGDFCVPGFVRHRLDLQSGLEGLLRRMPRRRAQEVRRLLRKDEYAVEVSADRAHFDFFYDRPYRPFVAERHGSLARPVSRESARRIFESSGCLLRILHQGRCIAGGLLAELGDTYRWELVAIEPGCAPAAYQDLRLGLYLYAVQHAIAREKRWLDLSGTKPFLSDGLFRYKHSLGSSVGLMGRRFESVYLRFGRDAALAARLAEAAPFLAEDDDGLKLVTGEVAADAIPAPREEWSGLVQRGVAIVGAHVLTARHGRGYFALPPGEVVNRPGISVRSDG